MGRLPAPALLVKTNYSNHYVFFWKAPRSDQSILGLNLLAGAILRLTTRCLWSRRLALLHRFFPVRSIAMHASSPRVIPQVPCSSALKRSVSVRGK